MSHEEISLERELSQRWYIGVHREPANVKVGGGGVHNGGQKVLPPPQSHPGGQEGATGAHAGVRNVPPPTTASPFFPLPPYRGQGEGGREGGGPDRGRGARRKLLVVGEPKSFIKHTRSLFTAFITHTSLVFTTSARAG